MDNLKTNPLPHKRDGMKIIISPFSGFCFGVKRAVDIAERALREKKKIVSFGPLIHNKGVVSDLSRKGLEVVKSLKGKNNIKFIIPSHGIKPDLKRRLKGVNFLDATCPFVSSAQMLAGKLAREGYNIVVIGDRYHPEVKSIVGFSRGKARVVKGPDGARKINFRSKSAVISQTTQAPSNLRAVIDALSGKDFRELRVFNTICNDAVIRQDAAKKITRHVDLMLIIGDRESANTNRLYQICKRIKRTYRIESEKNIRRNWFKGVRKIGIATGASTPNAVIDKVVKKIKPFGRFRALS